MRSNIFSSSGGQGRPNHVHEMLGRRLEHLRETAGIDRPSAEEHIDRKHPKMSRLERGTGSVKNDDLEKLLDLYGLDDPDERAALLELNHLLNRRNWWDDYKRSFADWFCSYLVLESAAEYIWTYEGRLVPGLLQTQAYAESIIRTRYSDDDHVRRLIEVRMMRQNIVLRGGAPTLWAIVDHDALTDGVGDADVMAEQIEFLIRATEFRGVRLQVLRPRSGLCALRNDSFSILRCRGTNLSEVVYLENLESAHFLDTPEQSEPYRLAMNRIGYAADKPEDTAVSLRTALGSLERRERRAIAPLAGTTHEISPVPALTNPRTGVASCHTPQ